MLLVFDLDGTLVDSVRDLAESASELVTTLGGRALEVPEVSLMVGDGAGMLVRRALEASGATATLPDALEQFLEIYNRRLLNHTRPYEGVQETLALASGRGRLAVLTNKPTEPTLTLLAALHLDGWFDEVIGGDGPFPRKPDPAALRAMQAAAGHPVTLMVGDSPADANTAAAAGCWFAWARYGFGASRFDQGPPDTSFILDRPAQLIEVLDRLDATAGA